MNEFVAEWYDMKEIKHESCISSRISHVNMKKIEEDYYHNVFQKSDG